MPPRETTELAVRDLHDEVDRAASRLSAKHRLRLTCKRGCSSCCVDELTVFTVEADRIRARHGDLLTRDEPHPVGGCAFLDEQGACRIYDVRPYVCRTQGLPLRWLDEHEGQTVEFRDICHLNEVADEPVESLPIEDCWTIGPFESRLATLQATQSDQPAGRVALRSLFGPCESHDS